MNREVNRLLETMKKKMVEAAPPVSTELRRMLADAAEEFGKKYAKTPFIMGGPEVETHGNVTVLRGNLKPYNASKIDSFIVIVDGGMVEVRVMGSAPSDDVEAQGFMQTSAQKLMALKGLTSSKLAETLAELGKKAA